MMGWLLFSAGIGGMGRRHVEAGGCGVVQGCQVRRGRWSLARLSYHDPGH